ncbi:Protogenin [Trichinella pseudospiralis]|uniref:Protogenin n=1 Tax=Trichinella pseudospiralis TaxID=6337 RepID=A0A0V1FIA4_TRIPS|nr:Protogenin [Trichinella pseudospiralis]
MLGALVLLTPILQHSIIPLTNAETVFSYILPPTKVSVYENRIQFLHTPEDTVVTPGSTVRFQCIAVDEVGFQLESRWLHNDHLMPDMNVKENSSSLIIVNVSEKDQGVYQCIVLSRHYGILRSGPVNLTLAKFGSFVNQPSDIVVDNGSFAEFTCTIYSYPPATVHWYFNERLIGDNSKHIRVDNAGISSTLYVVNASIADQGTYFCLASNMASNATSRKAVLTISGNYTDSLEHIRIFKAPQNLSVLLGKPAVFDFYYYSNKPISVHWKREKVSFSSRAFKAVSSLVIQHVDEDDEGFYRCIVEVDGNRFKVYRVYLKVTKAPQIVDPPVEVRGFRGETVRFVCNVIGTPTPDIYWYKDGERVLSKGRHKLFPTEAHPPEKISKNQNMFVYKRDLVVSSFRPEEDGGIYQCFAENAYGTISAAAALIPDSTNIIHDDGPKNLMSEVSQIENQIILTWDEPQTLNGDLIAYIIHYHPTESGAENTYPVTPVDSCRYGTCRAVCCAHAEFELFTNYTFWVSALVQNDQRGSSFTRPSNEIVIPVWDGTAVMPALLTVVGVNDGLTVFLKWNPPDSRFLRGVVTEYRIQYRLLSEKSEASITVVPALIEEFTVKDLTADGVYVFQVVPRTRAGYPVNQKIGFPWLRYRAKQLAENSISAPNFEVISVNHSTIEVHVIEDFSAVGSKWKIVLARPDNHAIVFATVVPIKQNVVTIGNLDSNSLYEVTCSAMDKKGDFGLSIVRLIRTVEPSNVEEFSAHHSILPPPTNIQCKDKNPLGGIRLIWKPPLAKVSNYRVRYSRVLSDDEILNISTAHVLHRETEANEMIFTDLAKGKPFMFAVRAETQNGITSWYSDDIVCIMPGSPPREPVALTVEYLNSTSVILRWRPPAISSSKEKILMYYVSYAEDSNPSTSPDKKEITVDGEVNCVTVSNLSASAVYFFTASAVNAFGRSQESKCVPAVMRSTANAIAPKVVIFERISYSEGILIGVCIAVLCILVCITVMVYRSKRNFRICHNGSSEIGSRQNSLIRKHFQGASSVARSCDGLEMQTLLPYMSEGYDFDLKSAIPFVSLKSDDGISKYSGFDTQKDMSVEQEEEVTHRVIVDHHHHHHHQGMVTNLKRVDTLSGDDSCNSAATPSSTYDSKQHSDSIQYSSMPNLTDSGVDFEDAEYSKCKLSAHTCNDDDIFANCSNAVEAITKNHAILNHLDNDVDDGNDDDTTQGIAERADTFPMLQCNC